MTREEMRNQMRAEIDGLLHPQSKQEDADEHMETALSLIHI